MAKNRVARSWLVVTTISACTVMAAQTEGDTGYDYISNDNYEDYDDDSVSVIGIDPSFDVPIVNVTVVKGQTAVLPCSIENLNKFKVAWLDNNMIPLTYEDRRVIDDTRFSVVRPQVKEWNLQVRDIRPEDEGRYRCTINTNPVRNKQIVLHVKVPAEIVDELSSGDVVVQEGDTVTLRCNVTGVPTPHVTWHRKSMSSRAMSVRDSRMCKQRTGDAGTGVLGAVLIIDNISRHCDDVYECEATNGVPPSVTRQMRVTVEFMPHITMPNRRIGQLRNRETILECSITAFPHAVNYWEKDGKQLTNSMKYRIEAYDEGDHMLTLSLRITINEKSDFGEYRCVASNSLGRDEGSMILYEYTDAELRPPTTENYGVVTFPLVRHSHSPTSSSSGSNKRPSVTANAAADNSQGKDKTLNVRHQNSNQTPDQSVIGAIIKGVNAAGVTHSYRRDPKYIYAPSSGRMTSTGNHLDTSNQLLLASSAVTAMGIAVTSSFILRITGNVDFFTAPR